MEFSAETYTSKYKDDEFYKSLLMSFNKDLENVIKRLSVQLEHAEILDAIELCHQMAGASATYGYPDLGRLFENIVYLDLRRLGCKVSYYLTSNRYEVDFVAELPRGQKKLFQVVWDANHPATMERETRALEEGMNELKIDGEIITLDSYLRSGIKI